MIHFVGAGCGAADLITVRGRRLIEEADVIIYAGSLVNPELLSWKKEDCAVFNSAEMTLEEIIAVMKQAELDRKTTVRLHTGDPSIYGAVREQMDLLDEAGIEYDCCPGVSSLCGAAAALKMEYTLPDVAQSVVITRAAGRTPVPERESIRSFAEHRTTMVLFLSAGLLEKAAAELMSGGYDADTPAAIVYKASWPDEKTVICTVATMAECAREHQIRKTALIIVGDAVAQSGYRRSDLYRPGFATEFRPAKE
ncbi:MAG: precorrin-4 C(11)-methyltransferase [Lachnospiraceae bacterium]|nr:precorrin-4 C(11)-methyltransferase [Lachnospiraceae bacterium]MBQ6242586.1 precorrin-4 C(11)-methyltransferase [Lachnospiraceae bacterium]